MKKTIYNDEIVDFLKKSSSWFSISSGEIKMFCPYCDDATRKGPGRKADHGHLYISTKDPVFLCQRCKATGHITKMLTYLQFGGEVPDEVLKFQEVKKTNKLNNLYKETYVDLNFNYDNYFLHDNKIRYLLKRHILNPKKDIIEQLSNLKIITDLKKFCKENPDKTKRLVSKPNFNFLCNNYVGLVSYANNCIEFRNVDESSKFRFHRYKFLEDVKYKWCYRFRDNEIKALDVNSVSNSPIIMSEGVMDLMFIHTDYRAIVSEFVNMDLDDCVLIATGKNFFDGLEFIREKIFNFEPDMIVLLDKEMSVTRQIRNAFKYSTCKSVRFLKNKTGNDFNNFPIEPDSVFYRNGK